MSTKGKVFVVDDDELIVASLVRALKRDGYEVRGAGTTRGLVDSVSAWSPEVVLLDIGLPGGNGLDVLQEIQSRAIDTEVVMLTGDATAGTATRAMKSGAADYLTKPFDLDEVRLVIGKLTEKQRLKREVEYLRRDANKRAGRELVGHSSAIQELRAKIATLGAAGVKTVLVTGESGTGKELVARSLHESRRGAGEGYSPFIGVNCTALPDTLIESELFGHEKGAFTDAKTDKKGVFELASGGSLLLDEIGDMPPDLQGKLLRVLEERTVRRIGGKQELPVDATVLATTNRDLSTAARGGAFRVDLFYRLSTFQLHVPPLRKRGRDIIELATHFAVLFSQRYGKKPVAGFSPECERALVSHSWPGNVRELRNVMERIVVLESAEVVGIEHLPREIVAGDRGVQPQVGGSVVLPSGGLSMEAVKRDLILQALEKTGHNKMAAARLLDLSYETLRYQMKRFGIK